MLVILESLSLRVNSARSPANRCPYLRGGDELVQKRISGVEISPWRAISFLVYWNMSCTVETLNETVDAEVEALPEDMRARLARIAKFIEEKGLERAGEPHVKHIEGRLWEMRRRGAAGFRERCT